MNRDEERLPPEQRELYQRMVRESEGFDVPDFEAVEYGQIIRVPSLELQEELNFSCELAIKHYKKVEGKSLKLVEIVKANVSLACLYWFYITFLAEDTESGKADEYQARVHCSIEREKSEVTMMRLTGCTSTKESSLPRNCI